MGIEFPIPTPAPTYPAMPARVLDDGVRLAGGAGLGGRLGWQMVLHGEADAR
jgi:hypothetical protein